MVNNLLKKIKNCYKISLKTYYFIFLRVIESQPNKGKPPQNGN